MFNSKVGLSFGIILLFVFSASAPLSLGNNIRSNVEKINNSNILDYNEFKETFQKIRMENHHMLDRNDIQEIFASDGATDDLFGDSVSIDGEVMGQYGLNNQNYCLLMEKAGNILVILCRLMVIML
ncbi:hypothetical protein AYK24_03980 [Thermoplasmatales archaeon SG8-52-4]|nr:MAG: hypothetical protein AYK24_03980 [Thermoplasmatales archaeon SG8-52-4]